MPWPRWRDEIGSAHTTFSSLRTLPTGKLEGKEEKIKETGASRGGKGGSVWNREEQEHTKGKSKYLHGNYWNEGWPASWPADCRIMDGKTLPLLGSEVLSSLSLPQLTSEICNPCWSLSIPLKEEYLFYTQIDSQGLFLKEQKGPRDRSVWRLTDTEGGNRYLLPLSQ